MGVALKISSEPSLPPEPPLPRCITVEEYLAFEEKSAVRTEYLNGRIYFQGVPFDPATKGINGILWAMSGAMPEHDRVVVNLITTVHPQIKGKSCRVHTQDQRIELTGTQQYVYPDMTASCGKPVYNLNMRPPVLENPLVVVEVLSPSTKRYALKNKAEAYRQHPIIQDILFIAPDRVYVLHHARQSDLQWISTEYTETEQTFRLNSLGCNVTLAEIYEEVFD